MSFSLGFPNAGAITIGGKSPATINAVSDATVNASSQALGVEKEDQPAQVRTGGGAPAESKAESGADSQSITVKVLLKRLQELQQQLREQQQQLAAAQAAAYATEEARATATMAIQGQIADTNGALLQVSAQLVTELAKGSGSGGVVSTTA